MNLLKIWKSYGFEITLVTSILFLIGCAIYYYFSSKKGTWNSFLMFDSREYKAQKNKPPKESKGEVECKHVLEKLFNKPFTKIRPNFLSNPVTGGANLEIDCYNEELKLGVEYSGRQHYEYTPFFHKNKEAFQNQKYRDEMKKVRCRENGITLIEIPYTVELQDIEKVLGDELRRKGYNC